MDAPVSAPQVNGVVLAYPSEQLTAPRPCASACAELLRQAAIRARLLAEDDPPFPAGRCNDRIGQCGH